MNYIYYNNNFFYPEHSEGYSPSIKYPEYKQEVLSKQDNLVYDAIRSIFKELGLDKEHFGTPDWNPLGEYIKVGDTVLVKPNLVLHRNNLINNQDSLDCLVTHPSIIRCVLDYALIALKGEGHIYVGDAPVKDCNLPVLLEKHHYNEVRDFYKENIHISWVDLRGPEEERQDDYSLSGVKVNIGNSSYFYGYDNQDGLRIPNYDYRNVVKHHKGEVQEYCVNELVLNADVVINLPKPKTHRKSGYTGALKNFVGINYSKEYLPHHTIGDGKNKGDEFYKKTFLKTYASNIRVKRDIIRTKPKTKVNKMLYELMSRYERMIWRVDKKLTIGDGLNNINEGTWYGNDTLWRTVLDLNKVVHYADRKGDLKDIKQRQVIHLCDMIVSGECEGPLAPSPKKENVLLFGTNGVEVDAIIVRLMHFNIKKLQSIFWALKDCLLDNDSYENIKIYSNIDNYNNKLIKDLDFNEFEPFQAANGWAGFIEEE